MTARIALLAGLTALSVLALSTAAAYAHGEQPSATSSLADETTVRQLNEQLIRRASILNASSIQSAELASVAATRHAAMARILQQNPRAVLPLVMPADDRARIPEPARSQIEREVQLTGSFHVHHVDYIDGHATYEAEVVSGGTSQSVLIGGRLAARSGDWVNVSGVSLADGEPVVAASITSVQSPAQVGSTGLQRTAVILINTSDAVVVHPYADKNIVANLVFASTNPRSARSFYSLASYGQTTIVGAMGEGGAQDVYGPYTVGVSSAVCDGGSQQRAAFAAAAGDLNFSAYDHVVMVWNAPTHPCFFAGWASVGGYLQPTPSGSTYLSVVYVTDLGPAAVGGKISKVFLHEYGHNLGVFHAGEFRCGADALLGSDCFNIEYGDPADIMGGGADGQPNAVHKDILGWLNGRVQTAAVSGPYALNAYEDTAANTKVLKVPRTRDQNGTITSYFYLEYRQPPSAWQDFTSYSPDYTNGVLVHVTGADPLCTRPDYHCGPDFSGPGGGDDALLINTHPNSGGPGSYREFQAAPLLAGQWFTDAGSGVSLTVMDTSTTAARVLVYLGKPAPVVQVAVFPLDAGVITGAGSYAFGQPVTLVATANPGYRFSNWREFRVSQAYADPYSFTALGDRFLEADFVGTATAPPNDSFATATAVQSFPATFTTSLDAASLEPGEPHACQGSSFTTSVWYAITPSVTSTVTLSASSNASFIPALGAYSGTAVWALTAVAGADCNWQSGLSFTALAGATYYVQVGGYQSPGAITLTFGTTPTLTAYVSVSSAPRSWWTGQTQTLTASIHNLSGQTWLAAGPNAVQVNVSFGTANDTPGVGLSGSQTFPLGYDLSPNGWAQLSLPVTAPMLTGSYVLRVRLVSSTLGWSSGMWKQAANVQIDCSVRPQVAVGALPGARGVLTGSVQAGGGGALRWITVGAPSALQNALVDLAGYLGLSSPTTIYLPPGTRQAPLTVRRATAGLATTAPFTVHDDCGDWPTFIGGGSAAF